MYPLDFRIAIIKKREIVEAMPFKIILMMPKESRVKQVPKNQESSKFQDQDQESREDSIKISIKRAFQNIE